jgi:hypothetical protein
MLSKVDCASDKAIDNGVGILSKVGIDLATTALNAYLPGVASLFTKEDEFAKGVAELKEAITQATDTIINQISEERRRIQSTQLIHAINSIDSFDACSTQPDVASCLVGFDPEIRDVDSILENLSIDLMWPENENFDQVRSELDFSAQIPKDIDRFHSLLEVLGLRMHLVSKLAVVRSMASFVLNNDPANLESNSVFYANDEVNDILDLLDAYLIAIDNHDLFRERSNERFSIDWSNMCNGGLVYATIRKAPIGEEPSSSNENVRSWTFVFQDSGVFVSYPRRKPHRCWKLYFLLP